MFWREMAAACDINVVQNGEKVLQIVLTVTA
jgi:hypothetical protein